MLFLHSLTALVDAVLVARDFPELGSDLVAALAGLQGHDLAHGGRGGKERGRKEGVEGSEGKKKVREKKLSVEFLFFAVRGHKKKKKLFSSFQLLAPLLLLLLLSQLQERAASV